MDKRQKKQGKNHFWICFRKDAGRDRPCHPGSCSSWWQFLLILSRPIPWSTDRCRWICWPSWEGPSGRPPAGTDNLGRDVLSYLIYGARAIRN